MKEARSPTSEPEWPASQLSAADDLPTWSWRDTLVGATLTLVPWLALASLTLLGGSANQAPTKRLPLARDLTTAVLTLLVEAVVEGTFLIAPLWFAVFRPRRIARQMGEPLPMLRAGLGALGMRRVNPWLAAGAVGAGMLAIFLASDLYGRVADALHLSVQTNVDTVKMQAMVAPWTTIATLIGAVTIAPFCEELFFRSFLFHGLRLRLNVWLAVVLSAVIFGVAHGDLGSLPLLLVIGLLLAVVRWRARSVWPGMLLHMANNALGAFIIVQAIRF